MAHQENIPQFDVLVIGSCNVDLIAYTEIMPQIGETIQGHKFSIGCGGKGFNQCVAAAKLGASTAMVAKVGNDNFANMYMESFTKFQINKKYVKAIEGSTGVAQITVNDKGENHIIIIPGANDDLGAEDVQEVKDAIKSAKVVLLQFEVPLKTTIEALHVCHHAECKSILNGAPAVKNLDASVLNICDIFCVNETEAESTTNLPVKTISDAKIAAVALRNMGCKVPIITMGSAGVVFIPESEHVPVYVPVEKIEPVDTTGAGDCFLGALGYFIAKFPTLPLEKVISGACRAAAYSVQRLGTAISFPYKEDLVDLFNE